MKTAVVLSDTHGNKKDLLKLESIIKEADYVFHLGDGYFDLNVFGENVLKKTFRVAGNCDCVIADREIEVEIEDVKILLCHGDRYGVRGGINRLYYRAKETGASVVFYGHTHSPIVETVNGITIANPGNITKFSAKKTFIYAVFHDGKATVSINENTLS